MRKRNVLLTFQDMSLYLCGPHVAMRNFMVKGMDHKKTTAYTTISSFIYRASD